MKILLEHQITYMAASKRNFNESQYWGYLYQETNTYVVNGIKITIVIFLRKIYFNNKTKKLQEAWLEYPVSIFFLFQISGTPLVAKQRVQFNIRLIKCDKIAIFKQLPGSIAPIFWIEEVNFTVLHAFSLTVSYYDWCLYTLYKEIFPFLSLHIFI